MRIYAKAQFGFRNPEDGTIVTAKANDFNDVPDWVKNDGMFKLGVQDGSIEVIQAKTKATLNTGEVDNGKKGKTE